jgi:hypothetical protein
MLIGVNKLAIEVGLSESEILNLATYAGVRRQHGLYDDREVLKLLVRHYREELFGCATVSDYDPPLRRGPGRGHHRWKNRRET